MNINNLMIHDPVTNEGAITVTYSYPLVPESTVGLRPDWREEWV